ncbi:MAG: phosphoribosylformylglycinamidine synthase subunit PurS [Candidatus Thermoplasmatota archaeon]|nr:phosphoribosylformylglycinamidine synthase subunit PurS [Candidatus Thermoplasmatota archaeon]
MFKVRIEIRLKKGISDPEGKNILKTLHLLGFGEVRDVKMAKVTELFMEGEDEKDIRNKAKAMCQRLLTNPVIHDYEITVGEEIDD